MYYRLVGLCWNQGQQIKSSSAFFFLLLWDLGLPLWSLGGRSANCTRCPDMSVTSFATLLCVVLKVSANFRAGGLEGAEPRRGDCVGVRVARGNPSTLHTGDGRPWMTFPLPPVCVWADCVPVLRWSSQLGQTLTCPSALKPGECILRRRLTGAGRGTIPPPVLKIIKLFFPPQMLVTAALRHHS